MHVRKIDVSEVLGTNIPEFFIDDIAAQKVARGECLRLYCGTWHERIFVPQYSVIVPTGCIMDMCRKAVAAALGMTVDVDQRLLM